MCEVNIVSLTTAFCFTYKQSAQASSALATQTCAFGSDVAAGDLLIACADVYGQTITSISDSRGNTWTAIPSTPVEQSSTGPRFTAMYWAVANSSGADTVTISYNTSSGGLSTIMVAAYTPDDGIVALDASGVNSGTSVTSLTATTGSATYPQDLLVEFASAFSGEDAPCGYTLRQEVGDASARLLDSVATSGGAQSVTETFASSDAGLILAAFSAVKTRKLNFTIS